MKTLIFILILSFTSLLLGHKNPYNLNLKHDGPTEIGGKINFIAEIFENGQPASGSFKYDWEDNTNSHNTDSHETSSPIDVWTVTYSKNKVPFPGKYVTTVTVRKLFNSLYVPVARLQIKFEIKGASNDDRQPHQIISKSWADYKRDKILASQKYALDNVQDPRVKSIVSKRIDRINERIPILSLSDDTPKIDKKREGIPSSLDDIIQYKREKILDSQNKELSYISNPQISSIVSERIKAINSKIPIMQDSFTIPLEKHSKKIEDLKSSEKNVLDAIQEPTVKEAVRSRLNEENERVAYLSKSDDVEARFSDAVGVINKKIKDIQKSQNVALKNIKDAQTRDTVPKGINEENKWLESKSKEIDAKLSKSLEIIHKRMAELKEIEAEAIESVDDPILKEKLRSKLEKQSKKVAALLNPTFEQNPVPLAAISSKIQELEFAETKTVDNIPDPAIKEIVLQNLNEQNKQIPALLKSSEPDDTFSKTIDAIRNRINDEIVKSNTAMLDGIKDSSVKVLVRDRIISQNEKRLAKSKEIESNLTASFAEIRNKIASLKKTEKKAVENATDAEKEEILDVIDEHNKQIPTLLLPSVIEANFTQAFDTLNARIANLSNFVDAATVNITNPFVSSMLQAKMNFVNYKLLSKYNQLKENFTALLDKMAEDSSNESTDAGSPVQESAKIPRLSLIGPGAFIPDIPSLIEQKMAAKQIPLNGMFGTETDPTLSNPLLDKFAVRNQIIQAKTNMISSSLATAMAAIRSKIAGLKALEDQTVADITDPNLKEEVQSSIDEENRKVPLLLLPYGLETNFSKALDAFHTKIDGLKNVVDVITGNITIPAIKTAVSSKFEFVSKILMDKYSQLDSNFTSILEKIQARFANLTDQVEIEAQSIRTVPVLGKATDTSPTTFDLTKISSLIKNKMMGKEKLTNSSLFGVKDPAIKSIISDKISERSKNMSIIADKIAANFTKIMDSIVNKTNELQELETLTLDNVEDPNLQAAVLAEIEEEHKKIPSLSLSKRSDKGKKDDTVVPPKSSIFKLRYPLVVRF